jgi:PAS domain S-box-containing protein
MEDKKQKRTQDTKRRQAEGTLSVSQEKLKIVLDNVQDVIFQLSPLGIIEYVNPSIEKNYGYKPEELIGQPLSKTTPIDQIPRASKLLKNILSGKPTENFEINQRDSQGRIVPMEVSAVRILKGGRIIGIQGVMRNIAERKRFEERLSKINECFLRLGSNYDENINRLTFLCGELLAATCALYNRLDKGLLIAVGQWNTPEDFNPQDKPEGHICYDVIKQASDEVLAVRNLPETIYAKTDPNVLMYKLKTYMGKAVRCGNTFVGSLCVVYQEDFVPAEADKRIIGIIASAICREEERNAAQEELKYAYHKLKETQAELVQSAKMASLGQLASGLAHEMNSPLTGVLNNVQLIKSQIQQKKDFSFVDFKEGLDTIEESAARCKNVIRSLLDFSRSSRGPFCFLSLNEVIEKVIILIEREMQLEKINLEKQLQIDLPQILGDPQLLQQAIFDIIANARWAIKETKKEGGLITIKTKYAPENKTVLLSISDSGIGIPEQNLGRIFEPFFSTKLTGEGTGLGLSIVHTIIKEHKGNIEVQSTVGQGTTFKISLPVLGEA